MIARLHPRSTEHLMSNIHLYNTLQLHFQGVYATWLKGVYAYPRLGASALHNKTSAEHRGLAGIFKAKKAGWHTLH